MRQLIPARRVLFDAVVALVGLFLAALATWGGSDTIGTPVAGPLWLRVVFPVLLALPLFWRRTAPLIAYGVSVSAIVMQGVTSRDSPEGLEIIYWMTVGSYSVGAYTSRRRAWVGLGLAAVAYAVYALTNRNIRSGQVGELWAGAFFAALMAAAWLVGVFVRSQRDARSTAGRIAAAETSARDAVAVERARLARELHDVVSHNLSVVVVQAAGARATGGGSAETLEKIEQSGRDSLVEMRRLLGVLRDGEGGARLTPQPGIGDLDELCSRVRAAGVPVDMKLDGSLDGLSPALQLSVYRIVQESLTNVLKHAGTARAEVQVSVGDDTVTIDVLDDGAGTSGSTSGGHGVLGMKERAVAFGGRLTCGPRPGGGFEVHGVLARRGRAP